MPEQLTLTAALAAAPAPERLAETPDLMHTLDVRGRPRSPVTMPGYKPPRPPANKGRKYPPDPLTVEEFAAILAACISQRPGDAGELSALRLRALIVVLWRSGLRISEALALEERDLSRRQKTIVVRHGKGDKRRIAVMDEWGWWQVQPWLDRRLELPPGQVFCVLSGPTAGRAMSASDARRQFREVRLRAGVHRRFAPHQCRHTLAVELRREKVVDIFALGRQLGHTRTETTAIYLRGMEDTEILESIGARKPPMMHVPGSYE